MSSHSINQVNTIAEAVQKLATAKDLAAVMKIVKRAAREISGADGCSFIVREGDNSFYADEDAISPLWKGRRFPLKECISGWVITNREVAVVRDIYSDERIPHDIYRGTFVKSLIMIPVKHEDPIAAIGVYWAEDHPGSQEELTLLRALADITAVSLENIKVHMLLEEAVTERTRDLEDANKDLQALAYSISHDLRAPLRAINGFMEILLEEHAEGISDQARSYIRKVQHNSNHMAGLIDGLFSFFKMGKKEIMKSKVPMNRIVAEITANFEQLQGRTIEFRQADLPDGYADHILIKQVWQNIIGNAVKYTSRRQLAVIEIGFRVAKGGIVYFVKDNGAGFDPEYGHRLFGVFQRLHTQREFEGSGIGLAIVQKIIKKHGGRVWAEGEVDAGAAFYFLLPGA